MRLKVLVRGLRSQGAGRRWAGDLVWHVRLRDNPIVAG